MQKKHREGTHPKLGSECIKDTCLHLRMPGIPRRMAPGYSRMDRSLQHTSNHTINTKIITSNVDVKRTMSLAKLRRSHDNRNQSFGRGVMWFLGSSGLEQRW